MNIQNLIVNYGGEKVEYISLNELEDKLDFFHKMYDTVRLVDPTYKKVIDYRGSSIIGTQEICYNYWGDGKICNNCISMRAHHEDKSFVKLEKTEDAIMLVTAIPIVNSKSPVVLELMKNATDSMLVGSGNYNEGELLHRFVKEMEEVIVREPLTSLYNRRFVNERLPVDIINATLNHLPLSVCFIDLDHFKSINDLNGHEAGDQAIKTVSDEIKKHIRPERDWVARYGGDEFLICFNNTDEKEAYEIVEQIQNSIERIPIDIQMESEHLSISYGIKTMRDIQMTAEELISFADQEIFKAKRNKERNVK